MEKLKHKVYQAIGRVMGIPPLNRKYNDKSYYLSEWKMTEAEARKYAKEAHEEGQQARVGKSALVKWYVYVRDEIVCNKNI